jgi:elongation factor P
LGAKILAAKNFGLRAAGPPRTAKDHSVKVIASSLRKGNVLEIDGKLYVVLTVSNFHPGKGTPTDLGRPPRLSDGVKVSERWRTVEQVERVNVDERDYDFLYEDARVPLHEPRDLRPGGGEPGPDRDDKVYLQEGMRVFLKMYEGVAVGIEYPQKITVEITDTEPVVKGQTASSSYKPATVSNGLRVMVPPHIGVGTRIVINTEDNSYVERAKD